MALDVVEVERLLDQESLLDFTQPPVKESRSKANFDFFKQQFMERGHEAEFLKLISSFDPKFHSVVDLKQRQQDADEIKQDLKAYKQSVESKKMDCQGLILNIVKRLEEKDIAKEDLIQNIGLARQKEEEYNKIVNVQFDQSANEKLMDQRDAQERTIRDLEQKVAEKQRILDERNAQHDDLVKHVEILDQQRKEAELREEESIRLSKTKDPKVEELGLWYQKTTAQLHLLGGIRSITALSDTRIQFVYVGEPDITCVYSLNPTGSASKLNLVDVTCDLNVNLTQIIEESCQFENLTSAMLFLVPRIFTTVTNYQIRSNEMKKFEDAIYDDAQGELLIQTKSKTAYVFRIDPCYPLGGLNSVRIVAIEPNHNESDINEWNKQMWASGLKTLTEFVSSLV